MDLPDRGARNPEPEYIRPDEPWTLHRIGLGVLGIGCWYLLMIGLAALLYLAFQ